MSAAQNKNPYRFQGRRPGFGERVFVADGAHVSGDVLLGDDASVWPTAVIRGDVNRIAIGARTNIQDGAVLHVTHESADAPEGGPLSIGDDVTVGHRAILHGCTVGHRCLVGMGAIVMDRVTVGDEVMIGAGALVTPGTELPPRTLWKGSPARMARALTDREVAMLKYSAEHYVRLKDRYRSDRDAPAPGGREEN